MIEFEGKVGHLEGLESPWGNAGGVIKTIEDVEQMAKTGVGWVEGGSYTLEPRIGNSPNGEKVYHHDEDAGLTYNSLGMPNQGLDTLVEEIPEMVRIAEAYGKKLMINVAPVSEYPVTETQEMATRVFEAGAHGVIVNAGCPNVVTEDGGRHEILSYNPHVLLLAIDGLREVTEKFAPVWLRLSPYDMATQQSKAVQVATTIGQSDRVVSALLLPNTWGGQKPVDENGEPILQVPGNIGGMSGPSMLPKVEHQVAFFAHYLAESSVDVIASSGIVNGESLKRLMQIGAVAGAGTTFYYESQNGWQDDTNRLLEELSA